MRWGGAFALLGVLSLAIFEPLPVVTASQGPGYVSGCSSRVAQSANAEAAAFQRNSAISIAEELQQFSQATRGYNASFDSVFDSWSFDNNCSVTLKSVNIVFQLKNNTGFVGYAVATEDPGVTHVVNLTLQLRDPGNSPVFAPNYSGYDFMGSADGTTKVYEALADWSIPNASQPYSGGCESSNGCDVSVWPGIVHCPRGVATSTCSPEGVAQTGSDSELLCPQSGCSLSFPFAHLWYEFWPQQPQEVVCTGVAAYPFDSVQAYVLNQGWNGGSTSLWNILITDNTTHQSCSVTGHSFSIGLPLLAEFITEDPAGYTLSKFNQFGIAGNMYYSGSIRGIYTPYSNQWYYEWAMDACGYPNPVNVHLGAVNSANTFTETWSNSVCT